MADYDYTNDVFNAIAYNNALQMASAQRQMDFQERLSSTAHTREVQDLLNAGLNPVLSAGGTGASTPAGSQASVDTSASAYYINKMINDTNRYVSRNSLQGALANANATMSAAAMNSAAAMYSANQHAAATKYSADANKDAAFWSAEKNYLSSVYNTDNSRNGTWAGDLWWYANKIGINDVVTDPITSAGRYFGK